MKNKQYCSKSLLTGTHLNSSSVKIIKKTLIATTILSSLTTTTSADLYRPNNFGTMVIEVGVNPTNVQRPFLNLAPIDAWQATDSLYWDGKSQDLIIGANGNAGDVATLDLDGVSNRKITVTESSIIGSIIDSAGGGSATLIINDGRTASFSTVDGQKANQTNQDGGIYNALTAITLGSADGAAASLTINASTTISAPIDSASTSANAGNINLNNATTFSSTIGATHSVGTIDIANTANFNDAVTAATLSLNGGSATFTAALNGNVLSTANGGTLTAAAIDGNLDFTNGGTVTSATSITGNATLASDASITTIGNIGGNATLSGISTATSTGNVGGNLDVSGSARFIGNANATNIAGTIVVNSTNVAASTIHNAGGAVTMTAGLLNMNDAADDVLVNGGSLDMNDATGAAATVTVNNGTLNMNDATGVAATVNVSGGSFSANDIANSLTVTGGTVTSVNSVGGAVIASGGTITDVGSIGGNLTLTNNADVTATSNVDGNATLSGTSVADIDGTIGGDLTLNDTASADIAGDITGTTTAAVGTTLAFTGAGTTTGAVTASGGFSASANRTFSHATLNAPSIALQGSNTWLELTSADLGAIDVTTNVDDRTNNITVGAAQTITGTIGGASNRLGNIILDGDLTANINTTKFYAGITPAATGKGTVNFGVDGAMALGLSDATHLFAAVNFNDNATITGDTYANNITVAANTTATFDGDVTGDISLDGGTADISGASTGNITSTANGGTLAATTIDGNLDFTNGGTVTSATSVTGNATLASDASITTIGNIGGNTTLSGTSTATSTGTVGGNLGVSGSARFIGDANATNIAGTVVVNSTNVAASTIHNAGGAVTMTAGLLNMNDAADDVTIDGGSLDMNDATGNTATVTVSGGSFSANDITNNLTVTGGTVTSVNSVGNDLLASGGTITNINNITGALALTNNANVSVSGDVGGIITSGANSNLTFTKTGTVAKDITALGTVTVQANRTFAKNININTLAIEGKDTNITLLTTDLGGTDVTSNKMDASHTITVSVSQNINGNIGSKNNPLGSLILDGNIVANVNTANFYSNINTKNDNEGNVVFGVDNAMAINLGNQSKKLKNITFNGNTSIAERIFAQNIFIANTKIVNFGGNVAATEIRLQGATSKAIFLNGLTLDAPIKGANGGLVEFSGDAKINFDLGTNKSHLTSVTFSDNAAKTAELSADIFAADIVLAKGTLQLAKAATITGDIDATDTIIDLTNKDLVADGNMTLGGTNVIKFAITDGGQNTALTGGTITINGDLNFTPSSKLDIRPVDQRTYKSTKNPRSFSVLTVGGAINKANNSSFITGSAWDVEVNGNVISITEAVAQANSNSKKSQTPQSKQNATMTAKEKMIHRKNTVNSIKELMPKKIKRIPIDKLMESESGGRVIDLVSNWTKAPEKMEETFELLTKNNNVSHAVLSTMSNVNNTIDTRVATISAPSIKIVNANNITGVAAGDEGNTLGAWFSPFYGKLSQKEKNAASGYENEYYGASLGFDIRRSDDAITGVAITAANTQTKHKNLKTGDKTIINSTLFSIYNSQNINDRWFALTTGTIGISKINNSAKRVASPNAYEIANSSYQSTSFSIKEIFGYNYDIKNSSITPMFGLKFDRVNKISYSESGTSFQNLNISIKAVNTLEAIAGIRLQSNHYFNKINISPELHGFVNYNLSNKSQRPKVILEGSLLDSATPTKNARANYDIGTGINFTYNSTEFGINYDLQLADKRVGHQGSLKLRLSF